MLQFYPSVGEFFTIFKEKSSHQLKDSNDKLSQFQCEILGEVGLKIQF